MCLYQENHVKWIELRSKFNALYLRTIQDLSGRVNNDEVYALLNSLDQGFLTSLTILVYRFSPI